MCFCYRYIRISDVAGRAEREPPGRILSSPVKPASLWEIRNYSRNSPPLRVVTASASLEFSRPSHARASSRHLSTYTHSSACDSASTFRFSGIIFRLRIFRIFSIYKHPPGLYRCRVSLLRLPSAFSYCHHPHRRSEPDLFTLRVVFPGSPPRGIQELGLFQSLVRRPGRQKGT